MSEVYRKHMADKRRLREWRFQSTSTDMEVRPALCSVVSRGRLDKERKSGRGARRGLGAPSAARGHMRLVKYIRYL